MRWLYAWNNGTESGQEEIITTYPTTVYQTDGGEFHPYAYQIDGPKELVQAFSQMTFTDKVGESIETGDGSASHSFEAKITEANNQLFFANRDDEEVVAVVAFKESADEEGERFPSISDDLYEKLSLLQTKSMYPNNWGDFSKGFGMGLIKGGVDMVGGLGDTVKMGCKAVYDGGAAVCRSGVFALRCLWKTATGQSLEEERREVQEAKDNINKRFEFFEELKNQGPIMAEAILSGDFKKLDELSGSMKSMASFGVELLGSLIEQLTNDDDYTKGLFWGRATFEIGSTFFPMAKLGAVSKVKFLEKLGTAKFFKEGPGLAAYAAEQTFRTALTTSRMCFVAGTLVWTAHGMESIEDIRPGDMVWSRSESGGDVALKPVLATFETHPDQIFKLDCDHDDDGSADDWVTGTAQHPFWCEESHAFVPLGSLKRGMTLWLADGSRTRVLGVAETRGPPVGPLKTYNFEVADFHTYFVAKSGIWVHNKSRAACDRAFSIYKIFKDRSGDPWQAYKETVGRIDQIAIRKGTGRVPSQVFHRAAGECMEDIIADGRAFPSYRDLSRTNGGHFVNWKKLDELEQDAFKEYLGDVDIPTDEAQTSWIRIKLEVHHGIPKSISRHLGIPSDKWDDTPAFLTTMKNHRVGLESLHGKMEANGINLKNLFEFNRSIPSDVTELKRLLKKSYEDAGIGDLWPQCERFLADNGR